LPTRSAPRFRTRRGTSLFSLFKRDIREFLTHFEDLRPSQLIVRRDEGGWSNVQHLLAHIYVSRSEALWKDPSNLAWFESQLPLALEVLHDPVAAQNRQDAQTMWTRQLDPIDVELVFPLAICRHVVCSESTSFLGFLPPRIRKMSVNAFDPLPPSTAISIYDDEYFSGLGTSERGGRVRGGAGGVGGGRGGMMGLADGFMERLMEAINTHPADWQARVREAFGELLGAREYAGIPEEQRENLMRQVSGLPENYAVVSMHRIELMVEIVHRYCREYCRRGGCRGRKDAWRVPQCRGRAGRSRTVSGEGMVRNKSDAMSYLHWCIGMYHTLSPCETILPTVPNR
jgi:hypothetical protein